MSYTPPTGVVAASWVGAAAYKGPVRILFGRWAGGTYVTPAGNNELAFGTAFVTKQQFANPPGIDCLSFAPALVARGTDYIPPFRDLDARWAGAAEYGPPAMPLNVAWTSGPKESQHVFVEPIGALGMGEPAAIWPQTIAPVGVDDSAVGAPVVRPPPVNASWYGAPEYTPSVLDLWARWGVVLEGYIYARGWQSGTVGIGLSLRNHKTRIDGAGGVPPATAFGDHSVWLFTRRLSPTGTDQQQYGTQWASHWLRYLTAVGAGDKTARGTPWASHNPRYLEPGGLDALKFFESHQVGGTRWLGPEGFDPLAFGERIIPEETTLYPSSILGAVGSHDVQLFKRYLGGKGFLTNPDDLRFGRADLWNLRQYIQQDYDPNDGLNPQPFGKWTAIENRNKEPGAAGWLSERHGYTSIFNKAWQFIPHGIAPPDPDKHYKAGSVTHWVQPAQPPSIEPPIISKWATIYNAGDALYFRGGDQHAVGTPSLENTRRNYKDVGNLDSAKIGGHMISDAIRELKFEARYGIEPPPIALPDVQLYTRYAEYVTAGDKAGAGHPALSIHWNIIAPSWKFHPPAFLGEPALRNVTPEIGIHGSNFEEFGDTRVRTQWRSVGTLEGYMTQWGRPIVRDRTFLLLGVGALRPPDILPGPKVTRVGGLPDVQNIILDKRGIDIPQPHQIPLTHHVGALLAYPEGIDSLTFDRPAVTANTIRVEPGYHDFFIGTPTVVGYRRYLGPKGIPRVHDNPAEQVGKPALSPHTIYAPFGAPAQARTNHPGTSEQMIDHNSMGVLLKGVGAGVRISHRVAGFAPKGVEPPPYSVPNPHIVNVNVHVFVDGFIPMRVGWPSIPSDKTAEQFDAADTATFGLTEVSRPPYLGPRFLEPRPIAPPEVADPLRAPKPDVTYFHRAVLATGWLSQAMGGPPKPWETETPFMWQHLRVGPLVPNIPKGFDGQAHGTPWVSNKVRDIVGKGWDSFVCSYDPSDFHLRMRVRGTPAPKPPTQGIGPIGMPATDTPAPDLRAGRHYIRPDGNAEQYRKGAPQ